MQERQRMELPFQIQQISKQRNRTCGILEGDSKMNYRTEKIIKAVKVLDMIQEACGDSECTKYIIPEVCRILSTKPKTEENKEHARELGEMLKKGMTFQMPADSEVEV